MLGDSVLFLKKANSELFAAFVSGQSLPLKDGIYGILTIVDVTELKGDIKSMSSCLANMKTDIRDLRNK